MVFRMPVPFVDVRKSPLKPIRPLEGMWNSSRMEPSDKVLMPCSSPFRSLSIWITVPENSSGTSTYAISIGSSFLPRSS